MTRFAAVLATSLLGACLVTKPIVPAAGKVALAVDLPAHLTLHNVPSGELTIEGSVDAKNGPLTVALFADDKEVMGLVAEGKETFTLRWTLPLGEDAIVHRLAVRATSALGGEALGAVTAAVVVDTAITVACTPDKATIGATITCQALNDGAPLSVVWQATGVTIAESGAVTSSVAVAGEVAATYRSDAHSATIAFFDPPPAATISAPSIVTAGKVGTSASVASAPDMSYAWTISNGSIDVNGVAAAAFTPGPAGIATLAVTIANGAGATTTASKSLTIVAPPTTPIVTAPAAFSLGSGNIIASITNPVGGVVYTWQVSGGTLLGGQGSTSAIIAPSDVGTVIATATTTNAAGDTASGQASTNVVAAPLVPTIVAPLKVSTGISKTVSIASPQAGITYSWSTNAGSITSPTVGTSMTFTPGAIGAGRSITAVASNAAGGMVQGYVFIDVINPPAPCVITTASQVSVGKTGRTASTTTSADHTYSWAIFPGGLITGGAATANMTYTAPGSPMMLDVRCRSTNGANDFVDTTEVVDVIPLPSQCSVSMATQVTVSRQNLPATANAQPGVTFNWGVSCGAITSGQGTTQLRYTACGSPGIFDLSCQACNGAGDCATMFTLTPTANPTGMELMFGAIGSSGRVDGLSSGGASRLNVPRGMAVARTTGTIAIAESGNQCVRLISGNFLLSTLPGIDCTPGSQTLNSPVGVAIRNVGVTRETYIADNLGQTIWKQVDNGAATIIAGASGATGTANSATGTSARFNFPADLSIDERNDADPSNDVLYIADNANHAIRKMSLVAPYAVSNAIGAPGTAGTNYGTAGLPVTGASARLTNPTALAMSRDNLTLYAAEVNDEAIAASLIGSVFLMQIYKSPPVLGSYRHAAYDFEGRLWLTATAADQIRDAAGVATSIGSGTGTPMTLPAALGGNFDAPDGIVVDPWTGDLYVSSSTQHVIVRVRH